MYVAAQPTYKVFAVISKHYTDDKYSQIAKLLIRLSFRDINCRNVDRCLCNWKRYI